MVTSNMFTWNVSVQSSSCYIITKHGLEAFEIDLPTYAEIVGSSFINCKDLKKSLIVGSLFRPTEKTWSTPKNCVQP